MLSAEQYYAKNFMHTLAFYNIHCILGFIDKLRERERERGRDRERKRKRKREREGERNRDGKKKENWRTEENEGI